MAEGGPKDPKREDAGVIGTSLLNASAGSMIVDGRNDGLGTVGVLAGVCAGLLAGVRKGGVLTSSGGMEDDDGELGVGGMPKASAPGDGALADGVS